MNRSSLSPAYQLLSFIVIPFCVLFKKTLPTQGDEDLSSLFFWKVYRLGLHVLDQDPSRNSFYVQCEVGVIILQLFQHDLLM